MGFGKLGLDKKILKVIEEQGFSEPTEIQEKSLPLAIKGKDVVGGSATGSGKTLAFAAPIIQNLKKGNKPRALILTPTRELAQQITDTFKLFSRYYSLNVAPIYGGVNISNQIKKLRTTDIVIGTPGRILDHLQRGTLDLSEIQFLVLDEVDRMFDMGFKYDVEKIISKCPKNRQTLMFSATITYDVDYFVKKHTKGAKEVAVKSQVDHSKLKQIFYDVDKRSKFSLLVHLLKKEDSDLVMVFCSTRSNADFVEMNLKKQGIKAQAIHGGLSQNQRKRVLDNFHEKNMKVMVCTDVAARGLDISGVSHVYNYDIPATEEDYIHRIGRTARAGEKGIAINIVSEDDYENFRRVNWNERFNIERTSVPEFPQVTIQRTQTRSKISRRGDTRRFGNRPQRKPFQRKRSDNQKPRRRSHDNKKPKRKFSRR